MRRSRFLADMQHWVVGIARRYKRSSFCLEYKTRVTRKVLITRPRVSLTLAELLSLANNFFRLA